jgi:hypothetical protein
MMKDNNLIDWLLEGDVSNQYQVYRDLLGQVRPDLQKRTAAEGWGARFLAEQNEDGHWGRGFYTPKWKSTHYSLLDLRYIEIPPDHPAPKNAISNILSQNVGEDGGINPAKTIPQSDVCINGMFLTYACYFRTPENQLRSIIDYLITLPMPDGGFNCESNRGGAVHSSLHTTISILEGLLAYRAGGYTYRVDELAPLESAAREFILLHRLYLSDRTGEIINKRFLMLSFPSRWFYDNLRALVYFQAAGVPYDPRMRPALDVLMDKRRKDGKWPVQSKHSGQVHFDMEKTGQPSRWNTLRALRVLKTYNIKY